MAMPCEVHRARADLRALGFVCTAPVHIDWKREHTKDCVGVCYTDGPPVIWVSPLLQGAALYRVVLHELGHALGLNDRPKGRGIMSRTRYQPVDFQTSPPTKAQRKAWAFELAQEVLLHRKKHWEAA